MDGMREPAEAGRLRVLHSTELLDSPPEAAFDRLTRVCSRWEQKHGVERRRP